MRRRSEAPPSGLPDWDGLREQFIGLDESFSVKSYYPQLKARLKDLEEERTRVQESEALLQAVFRNLPFAFWSADARGVVQLANQTARRRYGMEPGRSLDRLAVSIAARSALLSDFSAALSGEVARHERTVEEGGEALWLQSTVAPILVEGSVVGVLGADVDVTRLKRAEKSLEALNAGLESKVAERTAQLQDMIHELRDAQDRLVLSEKLAVIGRLAASIAHELNSPLGAIESSSTTLIEGILRFSRQFEELLSVLPEGAMPRFHRLLADAAVVAVDFSEGGDRKRRRELTARFADLGLEAPDYLAELTDEISGYDALNDLLDRFDPETVASMIEAAADVAALVRSASIIRNASERAASVVRTLKNLEGHEVPSRSGLPAGKPIPSSDGVADDYQLLDVDASLSDAVGLFRGKFRQGVRVELFLESRSRVLGDAAALGIVWMNLITNALQAMDYQGTLGVRSCRVDNLVVVEIADSGSGIPESDRDRVFAPFFTTKPLGEGTGFGLVVAKRNVEQAGGAIDFESRPGRTVFRVTLPAAGFGGGEK